VNLATGVATGTAGVSNIQNVRGGSGGNTLTGSAAGNILIGGSGNDTLTGGSGRSILIGDGGSDRITGGANDDILIGGTTSYDASSSANDAALASILQEWQSTDSNATRVADIRGPQTVGLQLNGTNYLVLGTTVQDDGATDTLTGNAGLDWFFANPSEISDLLAGESTN
jgi:Ca2+-binding RTX toxin-like protein